MKIDDIQVIGKKRVLAKAKDVEAFESERWLKFPAGYREFITTLGEGVLGGTFVRVYPPWRIEKELDEWRQRINKFWFWDKGRKLLPKERALECVILGDTLNGDELVFHPMRPNQLFVLPRDSENNFLAGDDLLSTVEWMCSSGKLTKRFAERQFEPFDSRKEEPQRASGSKKSVDPEGESLDDIIEMGKRWAKRHAARKSAKEKFDDYFKDYLSEIKDKAGSLLCEAVIVVGDDWPFSPGYVAMYRVKDNASGLDLGIYSCVIGDGSRASGFEPNSANIAKLREQK